MSLDKGISHNKEHRKPYYGSKAIDKTCRNHGGCGWCLENRTIRAIKENARTAADLKEYYEDAEGFLSENDVS